MKRKPIRILAVLFAFAIFMSNTLAVSATSVDNQKSKTHRVSDGLLSGDIPSLSDLSEVISAQMDSSLDDGITATIDDEGNIQIIQVINANQNSRSSSASADIAVSTIMAIDEQGATVTDIWRSTGNLGSSAVYTILNTYLKVYYDGIYGHPFEITCTKISSKFQYNTSATVSMFYHKYEGRQWLGDLHSLQSGYTTAPISSNYEYSYYPAARTYTNTEFGRIRTWVYVLINGTTYSLETTIDLPDYDWMQIIS